MLKIIFGALIMVAGFGIVYKTEWMLSNFGRIAFFEQKFGTEGGSRLGWKLIGILVIFIGFAIFTNMIGGIMRWILAPLLQYM